MRLKKHLGQHLLVARDVLARIVSFLDIKDNDILVEIGPGTGNLTREVLKHSFRELHLIEVDQHMVILLEGKIKDNRVFLHFKDATDFDFCTLGENLKVFGNLPYNVGSLILLNTVYHHRCVPFALYMLQKEVAEKLVQGPSWLSTFVRSYYDLEYLMSLPARFFRPPPRVQSGLVRLRLKDNLPDLDLNDFRLFLTALYSMKRKALKNKLPAEILKEAGIDPMARVESLDPNSVLLLYNYSKKLRGEQR